MGRGEEFEVRKDALISQCGQYRYWLTRRWDDDAYLLPIIMLNPSTADAANDDPTIRRCMSFARRDGFGGIRVINLFAFRSPSPEAMKSAVDPFGPDGSFWIESTLDMAANDHVPVLCAWGTHGSYLGRDEAVLLSAKGWGARLACLGQTAAGHPRHPLYVKGEQPLEPYRAATSIPQGGDQ